MYHLNHKTFKKIYNLRDVTYNVIHKKSIEDNIKMQLIM